MGNKVSRDVAQQEVESWLDKKKVLQTTRETNDNDINTLVGAITEGVLTLNDKGEFEHTLQHPFGEEESVTGLVYKNRLNDRMLRPYLVGVKPTDADARITAYICALTGQARGIIDQLDTIDKKIAMSITVFFL